MSISFTLEPVPPFRLDLTAWALRRRPRNTVDRWDGDTFRRALRLNSTAVVDIAVRQHAAPESPQLLVCVDTSEPEIETRDEVTTTLRRMLGLDVDLRDFYLRTQGDPYLQPFVQRFRGLKPPRFPSLFECLVNAIACQQLTLDVGITLLNRFTERFGQPATDIEATEAHAFPEPEEIATAGVDAVRALGFSTAKARAIVELGQTVSGRDHDLEALARHDNDTASTALQRLRGIGRWSAEYALLRGLGRTDVFPADDVGARNNLQRLLGVDTALDYEAVRRATFRWAPSAGLVYFHLLLDYVDRAGWLAGDTIRSQFSSAAG